MRLICIVLFAAVTAGRASAATVADDAGAQFFENKIRPLLSDNCYKCHSANAVKLKGGLYLDSREGILKGGDDGPAIVPAHPDRSKLVEAISWSNVDLQMPPKRKLSDQQVADLTSWVSMGAPWPASPGAKPIAGVRVFDLNQRKASHWCWEPIARPAPPVVKHGQWVQSPIDQFILAKLEEKGLEPAPMADRHVLIRRAYFDLIGLPPTPEEVEAFVNDMSPTAFARVVDHLLASDHFGERWARHWMDLVRYAETRGHEFDFPIPNAWQYRDYLIRAFNADVPYNQFVTEHIAGDLLNQPRLNPEKGFNESILGTGFWFLGEEVHSPVDIRQDEADRLSNRVDSMTKAFLGLTVGCARCHDHKFDAISQKDFYALNGFLLSAGYRQVPFESMGQNQRVAEQLDKLRGQWRPKLLSELLAVERPGLGKVSDYLLACQQLIRSGSSDPSDRTDTAELHGLEPAALGDWMAELATARKDPRNILHPFALMAYDSSADQPAHFAATLKSLVETWQHQREDASHRPAPAQVIVDFDAQSPAPPWYTDGSAFGLRPVHTGELVLGNTVGGPILGVAVRGAARHDQTFGFLRPGPGTEPDAGNLGPWHRSGQTVRTRTVVLKTGHVWYLVHGAGQAYAVVDSHVMIGGPLHGRLLYEWKEDKDNKWSWIHHDLSEYAGQRCHFEFSPPGGGELEIAKVIEAEQPPAIDLPNGVVASALGEPSVKSIESLAGAYQRIFSAAADRLSAGGIGSSADAGDQAALADFVVHRSDLFCSRTEAPASFTQAARQFIASQSEIASGIVTASATAPAMWDGSGVDENVLVRGVAKNTGDVVPRRFLEAIAGRDQKPYPTDGSGRLQLVSAMLADDNPFTSRVMVNRIWQHLFGRGIVPTVDNFGVLGQRPTHRELLDYLAGNFRTEDAWSVKRLIRSIMLSSAYQMSSKGSDAAEQADPENLTLHHMPIKRLEAEPIRDAILAVSGRLDAQVGGPPVEVYLTAFMEGRGRPGGGPLDGAGRRSIYGRIRRNFLSPMMLAFDMPQPFACVGRRNVSNVPAQALILMNDPLVVQQSQLWAKKVVAEIGKSPEQRIERMYMTALGREPLAGEVRDAMTFLDQQGESYGTKPGDRLADTRPWADLCQVMFNLKEFIFIE